MVTKPTDTDAPSFKLPDEAKAYEQAFAAFQGAAWVHQPQYQLPPEMLAAAEALGQQHDTKITANDIAAIEQDIRAKCAGAPSAEIEAIIRELQNSIGTSRRHLDEVRNSAISAAVKLAEDVKDQAVETPKQAMDRLWGEIDKLNAQASDRLDKHPLTDEQKAEHEKLKKAVEEAKESGDAKAREEAQEKLITFYEKMGIEFNDPELIELAKKMKSKVDVISDAVANLKDKEKALPDAKVENKAQQNQTAQTLESMAVELQSALKNAPVMADPKLQAIAETPGTLVVAHVENAADSPAINIPKPSGGHRRV